MANAKISQLTEVVTLGANDVLPIVNESTTKKITASDLSSYNQLGWGRYDDTVYTSTNKLNLSAGVKITLPNNAGNIINCPNTINYYDSATNKILGLENNDVYMLTVVFRSSAANTNTTHLDFNLEGSGQINRVSKSISYHKGNDVAQDFHEVYQYYTDADFVANGVTAKITAVGGTAKIWDIIFFIQRTQRYI